MKQKTAIQVLIDLIEKREGLSIDVIHKKALSLLPKEREQIEEAYNQGEANTECSYDGQKTNGIDGSDYYQQKYGDDIVDKELLK